MLEGVYASYRKLADEINWKDYNCNDLFLEYVKHENDNLRDNFFAGIVCRYWGYSGRIYSQCNRHVVFEECLDCIIDAIRYVLEKRVWENPNSSLYGDKNGPDKAIHIAMKRQKSIMLSRLSAQRRMSNFNTMSIDEAHENFNDSADGLLFGFSSAEDSSMRNLISYYFNNKNAYLDGMIIDCICFSNSKVDPTSLAKELKKLNRNNEDYFVATYNANRDSVRDTIIEIKKSNNKILEMKIKSLLYTLRTEIGNHD